MSNFRTEKDSLGTMQLDDVHYYGIQTLRALENFPITGYRIDSELIKSIAIVKRQPQRPTTMWGCWTRSVQKPLYGLPNKS